MLFARRKKYRQKKSEWEWVRKIRILFHLHTRLIHNLSLFNLFAKFLGGTGIGNAGGGAGVRVYVAMIHSPTQQYKFCERIQRSVDYASI